MISVLKHSLRRTWIEHTPKYSDDFEARRGDIVAIDTRACGPSTYQITNDSICKSINEFLDIEYSDSFLLIVLGIRSPYRRRPDGDGCEVRAMNFKFVGQERRVLSGVGFDLSFKAYLSSGIEHHQVKLLPQHSGTAFDAGVSWSDRFSRNDHRI